MLEDVRYDAFLDPLKKTFCKSDNFGEAKSSRLLS